MADDQNKTPQSAAAASATASPDVATTIATLLQRANGDSNRVIRSLLKKTGQLQLEANQAKNNLPPEGSVVLPPDQAKLWKAYSELGPDPKAIRASLDAGKAAVDRWATHEREASYGKAAEVSGYNPAMLKLLAGKDGLNVAVEEVADPAGKKAPKAFVVDEKAGKTPLSEYAESHWGEHLPLLGGPPQNGKARPGTPPRPNDNTPPPRPGENGQQPLERMMASASRYSSL